MQVGIGRKGLGHQHVFELALALGAGGLFASVATVPTAIDSFHRASTGTPHVVIAGLHFTYPTLNGAAVVLLALAALGIAVLATAARAGWRQRQAYRHFIDRLSVVGRLEGHPAVRVIDDPRPQAFCAGGLRPTVYVSQPTLDLLGADELKAVLAHEQHHLRVRDPLRFACGRIITEALFFLPVLRSLCRRYGDLAELRADDAAIRASAGREAPLASALLAFETNGPPGAAGISPERVDSLLGQPSPWRLPPHLLTASLGALSVLSVLTWLTSKAASGHATFGLPILSSQPCLLILAFLPLVGCVGMFGQRGRARRDARHSSHMPILH